MPDWYYFPGGLPPGEWKWWVLGAAAALGLIHALVTGANHPLAFLLLVAVYVLPPLIILWLLQRIIDLIHWYWPGR